MYPALRWVIVHWKAVVLVTAWLYVVGLLGTADLDDYCARPEVTCSR